MTNETRMIVIITIVLASVAIGYGTLTSVPSYDTETDCRSCHGNTTVDRHHLLAANNTYNCINCHPVNWSAENQSFNVEVIRNCLICHVGKNHTEIHHTKFAATGLYQCMDCHRILWDDQNQTWYPEIIRDCPVCHSTIIPIITPTPTPNPTPIATPSPDPNAPTGLHRSIECITCHGTQKTEEDICYQCHNNSNNSFRAINISYQFIVRNDSFIGMGSGYYNKVNTRHDITNLDQINSSTKLECTDCHSAHIADRINITIDPDSRMPYNQTMIHPGTNEIVANSITFCLKCHDNTWNKNETSNGTVIGPSIIANISRGYFDISNKGDEHGAASGKNNSRLIGPYSGKDSRNIPPMPCSDCHDPHGGKGIYHLKTLSDQYGKAITITSQNINGHEVAHWCSNCHYNPMNQIDGTKKNCLSSACHIHGKKY